MPGQIDEQTFEQSFAEMALATLKTAAPALIDYMMGFQLVEKNDDDTRAVGFFAFKVGKHWVYVPVFFLNGEVKGQEMMYVKGQDIFLPLEEDWINYLIQKKPFVLGQGADRGRRDMDGISAPDLRALVRPPQSSKLGQDLVNEVAASISRGTDKWASWGEPVRSVFSNLLEMPERWMKRAEERSLPMVLAQHGLTQGFLAQLKTSPKLAAAVLEFYQPEDFLKAAAKAVTIKSDRPIPAGEEPGEALILDRETVWKDHGAQHLLDDQEKQQVMEGNVVIRDGRFDHQTRKVFDINVEKQLTNPQEPGLYDMLTTDGGFARVLLMIPRPVGSGSSRDIRMVIDTETGTYRIAPVTTIWTSHQYSRREFHQVLADLGSSCESPEFSTGYNDMYTVVSQSGEALTPFSVTAEFDQVDGQHTLFVQSKSVDACTSDYVGHAARSYNPPYTEFPFDNSLLWEDDGSVDVGADGKERYNQLIKSPSMWDEKKRLILTDKPIRTIVRSHETVMVPKNPDRGCRWVKVKPAVSECDPGTTADLYMRIGKFAQDLTIYTDGLVTTFKEGRDAHAATTEKQAWDILLNKLGIHQRDAQVLLKTARETPRTNHRFLIERRELQQKRAQEKRAAPFDELINRTLSFDSEIGAPLQESQEELYADIPDYRSQTNPEAYKHFRGENNADYQKIYQDDINTLQSAAESGQKDVFDAAALGALINVDNVHDEIDSYISDMIQALDKLGRVLFLTYWHYEDVQDRYGKQAMRDLEDNLKGVFQKLGDTVLELRKRSPTDAEAFGRGILEDLAS